MTLSKEFLENLVLLIGGFFLTSVVGSVVAAFLQGRSWKYRWKQQKSEERAAAARAVFDEVSRLMDRRLFRVNQLYLWSSRVDAERTAFALDAYRDVMREWNDAINRNLSMLQFYFDQHTREQFDNGVGKKFVDVGALVEAHYRLKKENKAGDVKAIDAMLAELKSEVYAFNLAMLEKMERHQGAR